MKARILFLDDEPLALEGLRRMLRTMRSSWDLVFTESGDRALDLMARSAFDIVVSDMLMPQMSGAQLLNEVRRLYPDAARLILSGHAERELFFQCFGSAHQCLSKPCQPEPLKSALGRVSQLQAAMQPNAALRRIVTQMDRFPSVPSLYIELVENLLKADVSVKQVALIARKDPGLTAAILRLVNSAFFGAAHPISNVTAAIAYLGLDAFKTLVFNINAFTQIEAVKFRESSLDRLWEHCLEVARAAERIAEAENADRQTAEAAYTAGLLHDIGGFVLRLDFSHQFQSALKLAEENRMPLSLAERQIFGVSHADVGAFLLGLWGLPPDIVEAAAWHHSPRMKDASTFSPLTAVHAANALIQEHRRNQSRFPPAELDQDYLASLGLRGRLDDWRRRIVEGSLELPNSPSLLGNPNTLTH
ncbi:MAG: HDOD domain-containing protein [Verrucomicrobia bacterium]|nr:HDOD domain-containing protein [Verrucomicrobiota bacterium]